MNDERDGRCAGKRGRLVNEAFESSVLGGSFTSHEEIIFAGPTRCSSGKISVIHTG